MKVKGKFVQLLNKYHKNTELRILFVNIKHFQWHFTSLCIDQFIFRCGSISYLPDLADTHYVGAGAKEIPLKW